jgi:hypothetical protein
MEMCKKYSFKISMHEEKCCINSGLRFGTTIDYINNEKRLE